MGKFACLENCPLTKSWTTEERAALAHFLQAKEIQVHEDLSPINGLLILDTAEVEISLADQKRKLSAGQTLGLFNLLKNPQSNAQITVIKGGSSWLLKTDDWFELKAISPSIALQILEDTLLHLRAESQAHPSTLAASLFL